MIEPVSNLATAVDILEKLGVKERILSKLLNRPDEAAALLAVALNEVRRSFEALQDAMLQVSYLGVKGIDDADMRRTLDRFTTGSIRVELQTAKGRCRMIGNIYGRHLNGWFGQVLRSSDADDIRLIFNDLADVDSRFLFAADELVQTTGVLAARMQEHLDGKRPGKARAEAQRFSATLRPVLQRLNASLQHMYKLQSQFITKAQVTG
jgi:hypothetical protein